MAEQKYPRRHRAGCHQLLLHLLRVSCHALFRQRGALPHLQHRGGLPHRLDWLAALQGEAVMEELSRPRHRHRGRGADNGEGVNDDKVCRGDEIFSDNSWNRDEIIGFH